VRLVVVLLVACGGHATAPVAPEPAKTMQLNEPGANVDIEAKLDAGYVTVVDFWSENCGACVVVGGMLAIKVAKEPHILIRKVDVGDSFTPVAAAYEISALPHYRVYDKQKRLRYDLVGNDCVKAPEIAMQLVGEP
jgi:thiol-disulfide isomerase/thioredoxin